MSRHIARRIGDRLHLQHGPIDLIIGADGARQAAFAAAQARFATVLDELVVELPTLRGQLSQASSEPKGETARLMHDAAMPFHTSFVTRMAAVAGAVADTVLTAMKAEHITRAYVNNGGDIALHLTGDTRFTMAMADHNNHDLGRVTIHALNDIRGIATSGRHGRSQSLGIADSVTVLAQTAAQADVAATMIANAVDLPAHPAVTRLPANMLQDDSDLGTRPVVTHVGDLTPFEIKTALANGAKCAAQFRQRGLITGAALFLNGQSQIVATDPAFFQHRTLSHA